MGGRMWAPQAVVLAGAMLGGCAVDGAALRLGGAGVVVARFDADGDRALDGQELAAMIAAAVPGTGAARAAVRAGLLAGYLARDCDGDGRVTAAELARPRCA
jgi:hypothetical protein